MYPAFFCVCHVINVFERYRNFVAMRTMCYVKMKMWLRNFTIIKLKAMRDTRTNKNNVTFCAAILCIIVCKSKRSAFKINEFVVIDDISLLFGFLFDVKKIIYLKLLKSFLKSDKILINLINGSLYYRLRGRCDLRPRT